MEKGERGPRLSSPAVRGETGRASLDRTAEAAIRT
jgi:hypothetical protein